MLSFILPLLLPGLAFAIPAPVPAPQAETSPTLITFTYEGATVTATYYGTSTVSNAPCPTQTFTYEGAAITIPYTGPGTPQSCLTSAPAPTQISAAPCPTQTFTYEGAVITVPYTGPGTPQSCLTSNAPVPTQASVSSPVPTPPVTSTPVSAPIQTSQLTSASASPSPVASDPSDPMPKGFNYGSSGLSQADFETQFNIARNLVGAPGFTSARLYTMIQDGTTNGPIEAIPAAIATNTTLLLGLFYPNIDNELAALAAAVSQYGTAFTDLVVAISVGSEDLYRNSPTGILNKSNPGANPDDIVSFIQATRQAIANTPLAGKLIGHVDTWTAFVNGSNNAVIAACDFLGMDAYPYFQNTEANSIDQGAALFESAYQATVAAAQGKPVWITETGWPFSGPDSNVAVASGPNGKTYWDQVGCGFAFDKIPTYWFTLIDQGASPSFGVTDGGQYPLYDLSCPS